MSEYTSHVDGELVPADEATVSVRDRGFMYGDAVFETLRVYDGVPFEWDAHVDRLRNSADLLGFGGAIPSTTDLLERVESTLTANELRDAYVKVSVSRGVQPGKLTPRQVVDPTVVVQVAPLPRGGVSGERVWDDPATVRTVETRRVPSEAIPAEAKTHNYLNGILARLELRGTDADEGLLCSTDGYLTEGATSNLFFVRDGVLYTPSTALPILPGITRRVVLDCVAEAEIPVETGRYEPTTLQSAAELFLTNSTWEIRPVESLDGRPLETGPVTRALQDAFDERVEAFY